MGLQMNCTVSHSGELSLAGIRRRWGTDVVWREPGRLVSPSRNLCRPHHRCGALVRSWQIFLFALAIKISFGCCEKARLALESRQEGKRLPTHHRSSIGGEVGKLCLSDEHHQCGQPNEAYEGGSHEHLPCVYATRFHDCLPCSPTSRHNGDSLNDRRPGVCDDLHTMGDLTHRPPRQHEQIGVRP
jgi:hypothetical protein